jgi:hypothetical protein
VQLLDVRQRRALAIIALMVRVLAPVFGLCRLWCRLCLEYNEAHNKFEKAAKLRRPVRMVPERDEAQYAMLRFQWALPPRCSCPAIFMVALVLGACSFHSALLQHTPIHPVTQQSVTRIQITKLNKI